MTRALDLILAIGLATGLHLAAFVSLPQTQGGRSGGDDGQAEITLAATSPGIAALVAKWTAPPVAHQNIAMPLISATAPSPDVSTRSSAPNQLTAAPPLAEPRAASQLPQIPQAFHRPDVAETQPLPAPPAQQTAEANTPNARAPERSTQQKLAATSMAEAPPALDTQTYAPPGLVSPRPVLRPAHFAKLAAKPSAQGTQRASPAQRAAGRGALAKTGKNTATQPVPRAKPANQSTLKAKWAAQIRAKVGRNMAAPRGATATGRARVAFSVSTSGKLLGLQLVSSSGNAAFDRAALRAVKRARRFPKAPGGLHNSSYRFTFSPRIE